jgi:protein-S-isoprenylcysteine O-methyltransferase Ste14
MALFGKAPINWFLFWTAKISAFVLGFSILLQLFLYDFRFFLPPKIVSAVSVYVFFFGLLIIVLAILDLGDSLRIGLPQEKTRLKTRGLYRFSRNPVYVGIYLIAISAMVYTVNPLIILLGIYCIIIHHLIVRAEEKFLKDRFGKAYSDYCSKVRRYV